MAKVVQLPTAVRISVRELVTGDRVLTSEGWMEVEEIRSFPEDVGVAIKLDHSVWSFLGEEEVIRARRDGE